MFSLRDDIQYELQRLNDRLKAKGLFLTLQLVGGSALIMNGLTSYETEDMDTSIRIEAEIKEILDDLSIDINDDATDYADNYYDRNFLYEQDMHFSNIEIEYLDLPDTLLTKMQYIDDEEKMVSLGTLFEDELDSELDEDSIIQCLDEYGYSCSDEDILIIRDFLDNYPEY